MEDELLRSLFVRADGPLVVVACDAGWPLLFRREADTLRRALGDAARRIDHIGSTAVPNLAAITSFAELCAVAPAYTFSM